MGTGGDNLVVMVSRVVQGHRISFSNEDLPLEGVMHKKALYVTIKYRKNIMNRVLIDDGLGLYIYPLSTLKQLNFDLGNVRQNQVKVRAFDGGQRDTLGAVNLGIQVSPVDFIIQCQVMDITTSYNLLLGRLWIHMAGVMPSTLYQIIKFVKNNREVVVYGEGSHANDCTPIVDDITRGKYFQGIIEPIKILDKGLKHGLGYVPTEDDEADVTSRKINRVLARPIPHLYISFPVQEYIDDGDLGEGIWNLFEEVDTILEEEIGTSGIHNAELEDKKNLKPSNIMLCHKINEQNEIECDEFEDYDEEATILEHLAEGLKLFEEQYKPNQEETEAVNLGDDECIKETRISVHLTKAERKELINLLKEYVDIFSKSYDDVSVPKKDGKIRICIDYRDLNKPSPKDNFPLPNIHILIDNCAKHEMQSFMDCYAGYHQILMDEKNIEKTAFITPWGVYHYRVMPFGLKNVGGTYMREIMIIFHDMIHKEFKVYVDDVIIKSRESADQLTYLKKFFDRLCKYNLKLNPAKCAFGVPAGKLLGFIVSRRGIELDPAKIKTEECQIAFDAIKNYLSNPPVLVPPREGVPLLLYLSISDNAFGCVLGQHYKIGKKERSIYYLSKKFAPYEARYTLLEKTYYDLTWIAQNLRHYLSSYTTYIISKMDPLKYIFQKAMPTRKLAKWQMLLSEFDNVYVTQKAIKAQALADHLVENPVDEEYEPLRTYFPDEEVLFVGEDISKAYPGWRVFFDGTVNHEGSGIGAILISESGQHYPMAAKLQFRCTNNMAEYEACIMGLKMAINKDIQELLVIEYSNLLIHQV
ncbi:uncharacterized protein LOC129890610 [Solanum dulcamara]|uniref:uncharacterized protein LOC129890610 n=1 Tax=Solanum dulcamara TaxID=45834 RepID=UPI0024864148|nr:uncharacterized protein LOC129890610 [Solanum dulcamara]